jgi:hypothetical protein
MTHATRFVADAVLVMLAAGVPVQAQTPEIYALRVRAEAGDAEAQLDLGVRCYTGRGVPQDDAEAVRSAVGGPPARKRLYPRPNLFLSIALHSLSSRTALISRSRTPFQL